MKNSHNSLKSMINPSGRKKTHQVPSGSPNHPKLHQTQPHFILQFPPISLAESHVTNTWRLHSYLPQRRKQLRPATPSDTQLCIDTQLLHFPLCRIHTLLLISKRYLWNALGPKKPATRPWTLEVSSSIPMGKFPWKNMKHFKLRCPNLKNKSH